MIPLNYLENTIYVMNEHILLQKGIFHLPAFRILFGFYSTSYISSLHVAVQASSFLFFNPAFV